MIVSVVVPSYDRGATLAQTLDSVLASDVTGLDRVEVILVDDGSPVPVSTIVEHRRASLPFTLACLRQANSGPAAARNAGFRTARGDIVLFIDDDILVPPDLIRRHVDAHRTHSNAVICGRCPLVKPAPVTPLYLFIDRLGHDAAREATEDFLDVPVIASGQISVRRELFLAQEGVYRGNLATPGAEEFELSARLRDHGVRILLATRIVALHLQELEIGSVCRQQYKHGVGCAEAAVKYPAALQIRELAQVIDASAPVAPADGAHAIARKALKGALAARPVRVSLVAAARAAERFRIVQSLLPYLYFAAISTHFSAGVRDGLGRYQLQQ